MVAHIFNASSTLFFLYSDKYWLLLAARVVQGIAYSFFISYQPVWINTFAPKKSATQWISYGQSLAMTGIIVGYILGAIAADAKQLGVEDYMSWRKAIFTQGIALYVIAAFIMCYPNEKIDIMAVPDDEQ